MCCLYSKLWEERALNEFMRRMRQQIAKRGRDVILSAIGVASYNWQSNRITNCEIESHLNEFDYIRTLVDKTISCTCSQCADNINGEASETSLIPKCSCKERFSTKRVYDEWRPFTESEDIVVWRRLHSSGLYEYKVYGSYDDITCEDFLNVQIDICYRKEWDANAIALDVIESDPAPNANSDIVYWEMLWPVSTLMMQKLPFTHTI